MDSSEDYGPPVVQLVNRLYTPPLVLFGLIGNLLSVWVFCRTAGHRNLSSSYYLSALAVSDIGFLLNLFAVWLTEEGFDVMTTRFSCPFVIYSGQVTCFLSVWFVVAFTAERFCAVCYPLTRPAVCTVARARKIIAVLTAVALVGFSYVWVIADVLEVAESGNWTHLVNETTEYDGVPNGTFYRYFCSVASEYHQISGIASHVDSFLTLILPFCVITFLNVRITACVWKLKGQRETIVAVAKLSPAPDKARIRAPSVKIINNTLQDSNFCPARNGGVKPNGLNQSRQAHQSNAAEVRVTKTLLLVSTVFLVLNLPAHAIRAFAFIHKEFWGREENTFEAQQWANILFNTNFSVNFLLYCVSGRNFRKSLRSLCFWDERDRRRRVLVKPFSHCPGGKRRFRRRSVGRSGRNHTLNTPLGESLRPGTRRGTRQGTSPSPAHHFSAPVPIGPSAVPVKPIQS